MRQFIKKILKRKNCRHHDFSIQDEAEKLGMTVSQYEKEILHKHDKIKLEEIYSLHEDEMKIVIEEKKKLNDEVLNSKKRREDFRELEEFMNALKNYG